MSHICYKIFENEKYAKDFVEGKIFFSAAGVFSKANDSERKYDEGLVDINDKKLEINGVELNIPYKFGYLELERVPIFCFTMIDNTNSVVSDKGLILDIPKKNKELGGYLVVFEIEKLLERLKKILLPKGFGLRMQKVEYIDFENEPTEKWQNKVNDPLDILFVHDIKHKNQNEARIVITLGLYNEGTKGQIFEIDNWSVLKYKKLTGENGHGE